VILNIEHSCDSWKPAIQTAPVIGRALSASREQKAQPKQ